MPSRYSVDLVAHNCGECLYSCHVDDPQDIRGKLVCIRNPPQITSLPIQNGIASLQNVPVVNVNSICGEYMNYETDTNYYGAFEVARSSRDTENN